MLMATPEELEVLAKIYCGCAPAPIPANITTAAIVDEPKLVALFPVKVIAARELVGLSGKFATLPSGDLTPAVMDDPPIAPALAPCRRLIKFPPTGTAEKST
jgi:hypothetical protein